MLSQAIIMHSDVGMIWSSTTSYLAAYFASTPTFGLYPTLSRTIRACNTRLPKFKRQQHGIL
jgi:hypothetical protein